MPIRFRCAYCNQLMGISRRKAGTIVSCPKCKGQVIVPNPEPEAGEQPGPSAPPGPELFEHSDFEKVFQQEPVPASHPAPAAAPAPPRPQPAAPLVFNDSAPPPPSVKKTATPGITLSPGKLAIVGVVMVLLLGGAFFLGLIVGWASRT